MTSTETAATSRIGEAWLRSQQRPNGEGEHRDRDHHRHEPARHAIRQPLDRRARPLCVATICTIRASIVSRPTRSARMTRPPVWLTVPPMTCVARDFHNRHRLARHHRFVDAGAALGHHTIDRHRLARPHPQQIANSDDVDRDVLLPAVIADATRSFRREIEQGPQRAGGLGARAQFQHLPEQDKNRDEGRRLEINPDRRLPFAEDRRGNSPGATVRDHAVDARRRRSPWR